MASFIETQTDELEVGDIIATGAGTHHTVTKIVPFSGSSSWLTVTTADHGDYETTYDYSPSEIWIRIN